MPDLAPSFMGFRVYPRGFLGANVGVESVSSDRPYMSQLQTHQYHPEMFRPSKAPREVNSNVENLWKKVLDVQGIIADFDFRQKVLVVALNSFGTKNFLDWCNVQLKGPSTGDMHVEFLVDTLQFINTGKRRVSLHSWTAMLTLSQIDSNVPKDAKVIAPYFICPDTKRAINIDIVDVLQRWCGQEGGFEDLVQTLHVLFGSVKD